MKLITALATPFVQGKIDLDSYKRLLATQREADALLCAATTAEGALLSQQEKKLLIETAKNSHPTKEIWAGISSGVTANAVKEARAAKRAGADGLLIAPPAFFKCTEEGFVSHVEKILKATKMPIMLYNAPSRCGYTIWQSAMKRLGEMGVRYIKDAGNDAQFAGNTQLETYCGNEEKLLEFVQHGAVGVVSVVSNAMPALVKQAAYFAKKCGDIATDGANAYAVFQKLANLAFCEINPIPIKYVLHRMGIFASYEMRLPLTPASEQTRRKIDEFLENLI